MIELKKHKNSFGYDIFNIITPEGEIEISFQNNLDLYFRYIYDGNILEQPDMKEFVITKENYIVYKIFDELFNNIKSGNIFIDNTCIFKSSNTNELIKNNIIDWHSDDDEYENSSRLLIQKYQDFYKIIIMKSKKSYSNGMFMTYSVRISNSGSRYDPFNICFMNMYNKLKEYDPNYHQICIEEYEYLQKKKILK